MSDTNDTETPIPLAAMTLRDHFAILAGAALIHGGTTAASMPAIESVGRLSYAFADAMLAERAKARAK